MENTKKSNTVALLLCFFLGAFGAHRFYVGKTKSAITMLILTLTFFGLIVSGIWAVVDMFVIIAGKFTNSEGETLKW